MAEADSRQAGLFAAAFLLGCVAAAESVNTITPATPVGAFGIVDGDGRPHPIARVFGDLTQAAGRPRLAVANPCPGRLAAVAAAMPDGPALGIANLAAQPVNVRIIGPACTRIRLIDAEGVGTGNIKESTMPDNLVRLDSYAICHVR
jgi:hypothetical protein